MSACEVEGPHGLATRQNIAVLLVCSYQLRLIAGFIIAGTNALAHEPARTTSGTNTRCDPPDPLLPVYHPPPPPAQGDPLPPTYGYSNSFAVNVSSSMNTYEWVW